MFDNRITRLFGCEIPIMQAPMGYISRAQLASAVANAGAIGMIETSSGDLDAFRREVKLAQEWAPGKCLTANIAQAFVRDPSIVDFVVEQGVRFVTTSAGDPTRYTAKLKAAGLTVFHVVPSLRAALKAVDAGVDGLVVEGSEGGGFKNPRDVSTMVLLPLVVSKVDVPVIAAGGFLDGPTMAAAFALGAEGVQMGTRFVASAESPIHDNWKQAIVAAPETGTVLLNRHAAPAVRVLRTEVSEAYEFDTGRNAMAVMVDHRAVYFEGDLGAGLAFGGQVAGRIDGVRPVAEVIRECAEGCLATIAELAARYPSTPGA
jgi:enoyl-[acyl-carrier protein] reductase II